MRHDFFKKKLKFVHLNKILFFVFGGFFLFFFFAFSEMFVISLVTCLTCTSSPWHLSNCYHFFIEVSHDAPSFSVSLTQSP